MGFKTCSRVFGRFQKVHKKPFLLRYIVDSAFGLIKRPATNTATFKLGVYFCPICGYLGLWRLI